MACSSTSRDEKFPEPMFTKSKNRCQIFLFLVVAFRNAIAYVHITPIGRILVFTKINTRYFCSILVFTKFFRYFKSSTKCLQYTGSRELVGLPLRRKNVTSLEVIMEEFWGFLLRRRFFHSSKVCRHSFDAPLPITAFQLRQMFSP